MAEFDKTEDKKVQEVLIKKAQEGVEVRLVYDDIGCAGLLHSWYPGQLRKSCKCLLGISLGSASHSKDVSLSNDTLPKSKIIAQHRDIG